MEAIMSALWEDPAALVPNARLADATASRHIIHQDQPELVIDAVRDLVERRPRPERLACAVVHGRLSGTLDRMTSKRC